jgi:hypothetical protein
MTQSSTTIPRSALLLGLAGVLPFAWGVLTILLPDLQLWTAQNISPRMTGPYVQLAYGTVILAFMSGVLWGFATKTTGAQATSGYAIAGFLGLLALDFMFWRWGLAPPWWMHLRTLLTALVVSALAAGVLLA